MHIPDGFLAPSVWLPLDAIAVPAVVWLSRRHDELETSRTRSRVPFLGVMGAFVFAAQMINFPVGFGTSSHLLGGTLLAVILGLASAALVLTAVIILQAILFQDGGVLALGANVLNMALAGVLVGYLPSWLWGPRRGAIFLGGFLSVVASAALALTELTLSGVQIPSRVWMIAIGLPTIAGLMEGTITVAALSAILRILRPTLHPREPAPLRASLLLGAFAILLVTGGVWIASAQPDTLQSLASEVGVTSTSALHLPLSGYEWPGISLRWLAKLAAGLMGLACAFLVCSLCSKRAGS